MRNYAQCFIFLTLENVSSDSAVIKTRSKDEIIMEGI